MGNLVSKRAALEALSNTIHGYLNLGIYEVEKPLRQEIPTPQMDLSTLEQEVLQCKKCHLHKGITHYVFGEGDPHAELMFVGEAPGFYEDKQGKPFVGKAGQLLTKIINAMGMNRNEVYIGNILKCRPPENRDPEEEEMKACFPYLKDQIRLINPKLICALGRYAAQKLSGSDLNISNLRGHVFYFEGIKLVPTFHPSYLLRNAKGKRSTWEDMKMILGILGREVPNHG
jgi:uracil-DNA glycosylase family 4